MQPASHRTLPRLFPGHPPGLTIIVLTGLWEVFALFGMRTILVFYLLELGYSAGRAIEIYSLSTAAAFAITLVGAVLADRVLGVRRAVLIGATGMAAGHLLLIWPAMLFPALTLVVLANGLFKPSLVSQIGTIYHRDDPRRDRAFLLYKAGCNAGAIFAPIICGLIGQAYGLRSAIALCGGVMCLAALIYLFGNHMIRVVEQDRTDQTGDDAAMAASTGQKGRWTLLALIFVSGVLFWAAHGQQGGAIAIWASQSVDRGIGWAGERFIVPAAWFQSINPIIIVLFTPLLAWIWSRRDRRADGRHELRKMAFGALLLAGSFALLVAAAGMAGKDMAAMPWLIAALVLLAVGELYFDAIGQALLVRLAPASLTTVFISLWFLVQALGLGIAGWLGGTWETVSPAAYFLVVTGMAAVAAIVAMSAAAAMRERAPS
jgi:POT family proton-dependent oligopeptide transporter